MNPDKSSLNLGRFNQCVDYLIGTQHPEYVADQGDEVRYCINHNGEIAWSKLNDGSVSIPTFSVGATVNNGRICDDDVVKQLLCNIELEIFAIINKVINEDTHLDII